jgi:hypothetical protein
MHTSGGKQDGWVILGQQRRGRNAPVPEIFEKLEISFS